MNIISPYFACRNGFQVATCDRKETRGGTYYFSTAAWIAELSSTNFFLVEMYLQWKRESKDHKTVRRETNAAEAVPCWAQGGAGGVTGSRRMAEVFVRTW